ncbi:MAG: PadR family transcriptional regulator [Candidatus Nanohaloarchaeota archaeon QJJ-7]|nr:PadR family transcriptional regulator [Candidatus Nanohaloarchaeota archaeon QJJ-7]
MEDVDVSHVVRLYVLLLLRKEPHHGYELIKEIGEVMGKDPSSSHIYPFLKELDERGLVDSQETGDRGKTEYTLTPDGQDVVDDQIESLGEMMAAAVEGSIKECNHCDCEIYDGGVEVGGLVYCCKHCAEADSEE